MLPKTTMVERHSSSAAYNINYHFMWCPKYHRKILVGKTAERIKELILEKQSQDKYQTIKMEVMPDHVSSFWAAQTPDTPTKIVKTFKEISALQMFRKFLDLRQKLCKGVLWSPSYYVGTA